MAFWDKWFGTGKKPAEAAKMEFITPQQTEAGKTSIELLKSRAGGKGVAFDPSQLTMYGNPYAEKAMRGYEKVLQPAIAESYASRGLGKSNLGAGAETDALGNVLSDIGVNWAELNKWNEQLKQQGIENASSGLRDYMGQELGQSNLQTQGNANTINMQNQMNEAQRVANEAKMQKAIMTGANIASMFTPQGALSNVLGELMKKNVPRTATTLGGVNSVYGNSLNTSPGSANWFLG